MLRVLKLTLAALAFLGGTTGAMAQDRVKDRIYDLSIQLQNIIYRSNASAAELRTAAARLEEAIDLVNGRGDTGNETRITLNDLIVVAGDHIQYYSDRAMTSWQAACNGVETQLRGVLGQNRVETITCGTPQNVSPWTSSSYYLYSSKVSAVVVATGDIFEQPGMTISGQNIQYYLEQAYKTWADQCLAQMQTLRSQYANRFVAASCGTPSNVTPWPSSSYYQYQSTMRVWLKRL